LWTGTQEATGSTTDALYLVRADRLDCDDRSETDAINVSIREILDVAKVEWAWWSLWRTQGHPAA